MNFTLKVVANPFAALDHKARPQAMVPFYGMSDRGVGAELDAAASKKEGVFVFTFSKEPVTLACNSVPELAYYLRALKDGTLLALDRTTATMAAVTQHDSANDALEDAAEKAALKFLEATGSLPSWSQTVASAAQE